MGCYNSVVVGASADKVWSALRGFHDFSWSANVIQSVEGEGDPGQPGARRVLNGAFHETLVEIDDDQRVLRYSIDHGPDVLDRSQIENYIGRVQVFPVTNDDTSYVLWTSTWDSGGDAVAEFCNPIYHALLADLQAHFA